MSHKLNSAIAVIGIDIGKNSFHVVGHDKRGAITSTPASRRCLSWLELTSRRLTSRPL